MTTPAAIIFTVALIPYVLAWVYIRQLVREVNSDVTGPHVSIVVVVAKGLEAAPNAVPS